MSTRTRAAAALLGLTLVASCGGSSTKTSTPPTSPATPTTPTTPTTPATGTAAALQTLSSKALYFGHQSVGFNIMDGVQALIASNAGTTLRLQETATPSAVQKGVFAHAGNGSNGDPVGKTAAFQATIRGGVGDRVDIAFVKFCYVDFTGSTNVATVFADYQSKMAALKSAYPGVKFVHFTAPLTTSPASDNAVRERFSDLVRQAYEGREPLFDLAKVESTRLDGSAETSNGIRALVSAYSSDGGHLNATGAEVVSKALVLYLALL